VVHLLDPPAVEGQAVTDGPKRAPESVWDYPRPPRWESTARAVRVEFGGVVLAETRSAFRVLETSHPPVYYIPPAELKRQHLVISSRTSYCEWKGRAHYYSIEVGDRRVPDAAWFYPDPTPPYAPIQYCVAFYPAAVDGCFVDGERVEAQPGDFYGGWITSEIVGPFKGGVGTHGW